VALIDVSELLIDPDFTDQATLITRTVQNEPNGKANVIETSQTITAVIQSGAQGSLDKYPEGSRLSDSITVYYRGELRMCNTGGLADVIVWQGRRYQVTDVDQDYLNWGSGYTRAICALEPASV
jgi:hypothetical protein